MNPSAADFEKEILRRAGEVHAALANLLGEWSGGTDALGRLVESMSYSALGAGKRVRPVLALWVAEAMGAPAMKALPWAVAVEMIHTYSLIHDDLPCMDDDDERRGRPTNHIVFGEATALLAGDALLTEAFGHLAASYSGQGILCARLIECLVHAAGVRGMVGGQALDLAAEGKKVDLDQLQRIHRLKTGALIRAAAEGAAIAAGADEKLTRSVRAFGEGVGLAFQIADDILDAGQDGQDGRSYVNHFGLEETRIHLDRVSHETLKALETFPRPSPWLTALVEWNRTRSS